MNDWNGITDEWINLKIFEYIYGKLDTVDSDILKLWHKNKFQYCSSWERAGDLIRNYEIGITPDCGGDFPQWKAVNRFMHIEAVHENPLRAVAVAFLLMNDIKP